ncbi:hypothetical protein TNCV_2939881 [Trichonephila clavipes]|nr:hypothetical protein TNCV_2939881 [Trichonephila clavipes]
MFEVLRHGPTGPGPRPQSHLILDSAIPFRMISSRGSRVEKVSERGWLCHEFEPSTTKDTPCAAVFVDGLHTPSSSGNPTEKSPVESDQVKLETIHQHRHTQLFGQLDDAPAHKTTPVKQYLFKEFGDQIMSMAVSKICENCLRDRHHLAATSIRVCRRCSHRTNTPNLTHIFYFYHFCLSQCT